MKAGPLQARLTAKISAPLRSPERGLLVLGGILAAIFGFSLWRVNVTLWAIAGIIVGLGGLVTLLVAWLLDSRRFGIVGVPVVVAETEQGVTLTTEMEPSRALAAIAVLRDVVQNRQALPNPHGSVTGEPADQHLLRPYSELEREETGRRLRSDADQHGRSVVNQIAEAQRELAASVGNGEPESEPIQQAHPKGGAEQPG